MPKRPAPKGVLPASHYDRDNMAEEDGTFHDIEISGVSTFFVLSELLPIQRAKTIGVLFVLSSAGLKLSITPTVSGLVYDVIWFMFVVL